MKLKIENKTIDLIAADTFFKRLIGLAFKRNIKESMIFKNCNSIHTWFMKEEIDVILIDKNNKVKYFYKNLKPWKIVWPKKDVQTVVELPKNSINNLKINDMLEFIIFQKK